jgi:hypothetical protein
MITGSKQHRDNNPLYPPFLRGNPSNSRHLQHLPVGVRRKNLPLTALEVGYVFGTREYMNKEIYT